ncbi:MAG TPA: metallophosphoesterase [Candidatus Brocadiia bacterium]|nr:metallophosphoesterase [Candidatus Brocadiia bacterium]
MREPRRVATAGNTIYLIIAFLFLLTPLAGCAGQKAADCPEKPPEGLTALPEIEGPKPWTDRSLERAPGYFQFAVCGDRTGGNRPGVFDRAMKALDLIEPQFVMCVGDLIEGNSDDPACVAAMHDDVDKGLANLSRRFFFVPGNHDLNTPATLTEYARRRGPAYYHFVYRDVLFLCLSTIDSEGRTIGEAQTVYFQNAIRQNPGAKWTFLFIHHPVWLDEKPNANWEKIEKLLEGRQYTVFAGHTHDYCKQVRKGMNYYILSVTGALKEPKGIKAGEFDHFMIVTMSGGRPKIAVLALDGFVPEDIITAE